MLKPLSGFFEIIGTLKSGAASDVYTVSPSVLLRLAANAAQKMKISESIDGTSSGCDLPSASAIPYEGAFPFVFQHGQGKKWVCVQYLDAEGKETLPIHGSILYDAVAPNPVIVQPITNNGYSRSQSIYINLSAADSLSGVVAYTISDTPITTAVKQPFQTTIQHNFSGQGTHTTYLCVFDAAGNYSARCCTPRMRRVRGRQR